MPGYVALRHVRFDDLGLLTKTIAQITESRTYEGERVDGLDGVAFEPGEYYLTLATWTDKATQQVTERASDYGGQQIYYRSIQQRETDLLTTYDYLWRWDTDWFWCSGAFGAQNKYLRRVWPRRLRRSDVYMKLVGLDRKFGIADKLDARAGQAAAGTGDPGHRGPGREPSGVPGVVRRRDRDAAGVAVSAGLSGNEHWTQVADLPARGGPDVRQRRVLGHGPCRPRSRQCPQEPC